MSPNEGQEELEEVQSDLRKREDEVRRVLWPPPTGVFECMLLCLAFAKCCS